MASPSSARVASRSRSRDRGERVTELAAQLGVVDERFDDVVSATDRGHVGEGRENAPAQEARAHRGLRGVEEPEERSLALTAQRPDDLQVSNRRFVEREERGRIVDAHALHAQLGAGLRRGRIAERLGGRRAALRPDVLGSAARFVLADHAREDDRGLLVFARDPRDHRARERARQRLLELCEKRRHEHFARVEAGELAEERGRVRELRGAQLGRRELERREAERSQHARAVDHDEVVVRARIEGVRLEAEPRRDHADDLARHDALDLRRIRHLLADRDLPTLLEELRDVPGGRVVRHAGHRDPFGLARLAARGERDVEELRRDDRVLEEHLVEVAEPKEQDRVRILILGAQVLLHHGRVLPALRDGSAHATRSRPRARTAGP